MLNEIKAALIFFTRLPFWRLFNAPNDSFKQVINHWAIIGWLTAGTTVATLWLTSLVLPYPIAVLLAICSRLMLTGALHEDGLADFFDGFGGGSSRERILTIMKDSHIGTYGVLGLILYFLIYYQSLTHLPYEVILIADPLCKFIASQITLFLPYARNEETSKTQVVYRTMSVRTFAFSAVFGLLPLALLGTPRMWLAVVFPLATFALLVRIMRCKLGGYTGDCCGALFLLCELSFFVGLLISLQI